MFPYAIIQMPAQEYNPTVMIFMLTFAGTYILSALLCLFRIGGADNISKGSKPPTRKQLLLIIASLAALSTIVATLVTILEIALFANYFQV